MSLPITPRADQYIIEKDERPSERQVGSLVLVETQDRAISSGVVRGAPDGGTYDAGTRVYFSPYAGYSLVIDGAEYVQIGDHEILGTFEGEAQVYVA